MRRNNAFRQRGAVSAAIKAQLRTAQQMTNATRIRAASDKKTVEAGIAVVSGGIPENLSSTIANFEMRISAIEP